MGYETNSITITAAVTDRTGVGAEVLYQAKVDTYIDRVIWQSKGTNSATAARIFLNTADPISDGNNNSLVGESTLAGTTATETAALAKVELTLDMPLKAGQRLLACCGTAPTDGITATVAAFNRGNFWMYKEK